MGKEEVSDGIPGQRLSDAVGANAGPADPVALVLAELQSRLDDTKRRKSETDEGIYGDHLERVPSIQCADGLSMSVQASAYHYCSPRESRGPWWAVEVGFPSRKVEEIHDHAEDPSSPTETVYGYVPIEKVAQAIIAAGGFKAEA